MKRNAKRNIRILCASVMIALSPLAGASDVDSLAASLDATAANRGQTQVAGKIAANFTSLAGSDQNALALVNALRNGTNATLTYPAPTTTTTGTGTGTTTGTGSGTTTGTGTGTTGTGTTTPPATTTTTYDPPTGKMGWGEVKIALALAQASLASAGITHPTADQLQAALNGGDVTVTNADGTTTTTTLKGVLQMRADGMGWGQIAQANGTKLGPVVSGLKMANTKIAALPKTTTTAPTSVATSKSTLASRGITTAAGASVSTSHGNGGSKGLVTAGGTAAGGSHGLVTATGAGPGTSHGNAYGRGIVTATGGGATAGASVAASHGQGAGVVTATGGAATSITTAQGNSGSHGKPEGKGKGGG